jgi:hypothetical protein
VKDLNLKEQNFLVTIFDHHEIRLHWFQSMDFRDQLVEFVEKSTRILKKRLFSVKDKVYLLSNRNQHKTRALNTFPDDDKSFGRP